MRRLAIAVPALVAVAVVAVIVAAFSGGSGSGYQVRAIFDNAGNITAGEDVKVAGVKVGNVASLDVTPAYKAAVVLKIVNPGFQDFRADASCIVRPQSLIGEKFVECTPTQARAPDTPAPQPLPTVPEGQPGAGQRYLAVTQTSSPVDVDLIGDINRLPYRERLTVIINELGAGLAGRGNDLKTIVRRADPALAQTDRLLAELGRENRTLEQLAVNSDQVLAPLARDRAQVADSIVQQNTVAQATAAHAAALERSFAALPPFLRQLRPTMVSIGQLADQATPAATDLLAAAPTLNQASVALPAFASSSQVYLTSLGQTASANSSSLVATLPLANRLTTLGVQLKPFAANLAALLTSLRNTGGIERLMDFLFTSTSAVNGYDSFGHFLRTALVATNCETYVTNTASSPGCGATFQGGGASASAAGQRASTYRSGATATPAAKVATPTGSSAPTAAPAPATALRRPQPAVPSDNPARPLLNYLLGA